MYIIKYRNEYHHNEKSDSAIMAHTDYNTPDDRTLRGSHDLMHDHCVSPGATFEGATTDANSDSISLLTVSTPLVACKHV